MSKSFSELLAHMHLSRHLRHYLRSERFTLTIEFPKNVDLNSWQRAARRLIEISDNNEDEWKIEKAVPCRVDSILTSPVAEQGIEAVALGHQRSVIFCSGHLLDSVLDHPSSACIDAVIRIPDMSPDLMQRAVQEYSGRKISLDEATILCGLKYELLTAVVNSGRQMSNLLSRVLHIQKRSEWVLPAPPVRAELRLEDAQGYGDAKLWGLELARDIADYKAGLIGWSDVDNGLLLSGVPGCGKTTFAAALARTCNVDFIVGSYAQWQSYGHQGDMLKAMRKAFKDARNRAPCIFLIDEIDGFVERRSGKGTTENNEYMRGVVNGLLEELDGSVGREGVVVIGACNDASVIDPAVKRAGRLDRHIEIGLPDAEAREAILHHHLEADIDLTPFAGATAGMTGADLQKLARDARRLARRERVQVQVQHVHACLPVLQSGNVVQFKFH